VIVWHDDNLTRDETTYSYLFMALFICAVTLLVLCFCELAHAQTLTNADLGKKLHLPPAPAEVYEQLKAHEFHLPQTYRGPFYASTDAHDAASGPWDWPVERVQRRLDGTYIDEPPTIYGAPFYGGRAWRSESPSVFVHPAIPQRRSVHESHNQVVRRR
jgi:hypothetical protein